MDYSKMQVEEFIDQRLRKAQNLPFSLRIGGNIFSDIVETYEFSYDMEQSENLIHHVSTLTSSEAGIKITCTADQNAEYDVLEWTVWIENTGKERSDIIRDLFAVDTLMFKEACGYHIRPGSNVRLHHFKGDNCKADSYGYLEHEICDDRTMEFFPSGGLPTNVEFPFYRIQSDNVGMIFVVSWQGQWVSKFRSSDDGVHIQAGQEGFCSYLEPGERIRTPMILFMPYEGTDTVSAQNKWRKWFRQYNMPRAADGEEVKPFEACYSGMMFQEMMRATEENQKQFIDKYLDNHIPMDYIWMDAGWYINGAEGWTRTGTWDNDKKRFPDGIGAVSDYAHSKGVKTILWFETERVVPGTEIADKHREWCLESSQVEHIYKNAWDKFPESMLFNMGDERAREWITDKVNSVIKNEKIDLYRQDFNICPITYWQDNDTPDRYGMTENKYCQGYLRHLDGILKANPGILMDCCASGGRRNDLETLRRCLPLHKTDYNYADLTAKQAMHHSLFQWIPCFTSMNMPFDLKDKYYHRSAMLMVYHNCDKVLEPGYDMQKLKEWMEEWRAVSHCFTGDYYPLMPYSLNCETWIGWQFNRMDIKEGVVQMFRRDCSPITQGVFKLKGLEQDSTYDIYDFDTLTHSIRTGGDLMTEGLEIKLDQCPGSALILYKCISYA